MHKRHSSSGFTLIELLLVLAIAAAVATGLFLLVQKLSVRTHVHQEVARMQQLSDGIGQAYANARSVSGPGGWPPLDTTEAIANGAIPPDLQDPNGSSFYLPNSVGSYVMLQGMPFWGRNGAVQISYPFIPSRSCAQFVAQAAPLFHFVMVNGGLVKDDIDTPNIPLDMANVTQQCSTGYFMNGPSVAFYYLLPGAYANTRATTPSLGPNNGGTMPSYTAMAPTITPLTADAVASATPASAYNYTAPCVGGRDPTNPDACADPASHSPSSLPTDSPVLASAGGGTPPAVAPYPGMVPPPPPPPVTPPPACTPGDPGCTGGTSTTPTATNYSCYSQESAWSTDPSWGGTPSNPVCVKLIDDADPVDPTTAYSKRGAYNRANGTWNTSCGCYYGVIQKGKYVSTSYGSDPAWPLIPVTSGSCPRDGSGNPEISQSAATYVWCAPAPAGSWARVCTKTVFSSGTVSDGCSSYEGGTTVPGSVTPGQSCSTPGDFSWGYPTYPGNTIVSQTDGFVCGS